MSLTRIAAALIGLVVALIGVGLLYTNIGFNPQTAVAFVAIVIGVWVMLGQPISV